jgi:hypothetical protein
MRRGIRGLIGLTAAASALAVIPSVSRAASNEKGLLGIRILQSYRDVYRKYGQPDRVYRRGEVVDWVEAVDARGNPTGGIRGLDRGAAAQGFPGGRGNPLPAGAPGMARGGYPGAMPGVGPGGMAPGMMNDLAAMGVPGMPAGPNMQGGMAGRGGLPGFAGGRPAGMPGAMPGMPGSYPGIMGGGRTGTNALGGGNTFLDSGGYIWVYFSPKKELLYEFYFNRDGRVEIIAEYGRIGGGRTQRGIGLGSSLQNVYNVYGWPSDTDQNGRYFTLFYGPSAHAQFMVINNKVVGIGVMLREDQKITMFDRGNQSNTGFGAGRPGMQGGMPGRGGYPGMMGGPGMMGVPGGYPGGLRGGGRGGLQEDK